jgi:hypothetical protein
MNDVVRSGHVPALTVATASLLSAGTLTSFSSGSSWLALWALALVAAVAMFRTADTPGALSSVRWAIVAMLCSAALCGVLDGAAASLLAGLSSVVFLALATRGVVTRASRVPAD